MNLTREDVVPNILKELFSYNEESGRLFWKNPTGKRAKSGDEAGHITWNGYRRTTINGIHYFSHRIIFAIANGRFPVGEIDHINGNRLDNRLCNLREVSRTQNLQNMKTPKNNTSGVMGVSFNKRADKWRAKITVDGRVIEIIETKIFEDAVSARKSAERKYGFHANHGR